MRLVDTKQPPLSEPCTPARGGVVAPIFFVAISALCVLLMAYSNLSPAQAPEVRLPPTAFEVLRFQFHDADTVRGDIRLPWSSGLFDRSIRASGYDAWEVDKTRSKVYPFSAYSSGQWSLEIANGIKSRDAIRTLTAGGRVYIEWNPKDENSVYGRLEGPLWAVTKDGRVVELKRWAEDNGHVRK